MNHFELLIVALILDAILGEPDWLWDRMPHPATLMGRAINWFEGRLNHGENRRIAGFVTVGVLVSAAAVIGWVIQSLPDFGLLEALIGAVLLAQKSLVEHVRAVAVALRENLSEGRKAVAMIVGRDPENLDESSVARGAIESAAENFSDGVIAPAFWFLLFGLPGIMVYKLVNTADSMIGHRTERYAQFGWAAAKLDDVINWIPARLTGGLICIAYLSKPAWDVMQQDASLHRSPNAGWPEAATAGVLDISLSGPRSYDGQMMGFPWVNAAGRQLLTPDDIDSAVRVLWRSWWLLVVVLGGTAVVL